MLLAQIGLSLNEMGAAWALKANCTSLLLPGFKFEEMKGVVNNYTIAIKLDSDEYEVKDKLDQLYAVIRPPGRCPCRHRAADKTIRRGGSS